MCVDMHRRDPWGLQYTPTGAVMTKIIRNVMHSAGIDVKSTSVFYTAVSFLKSIHTIIPTVCTRIRTHPHTHMYINICGLIRGSSLHFHEYVSSSRKDYFSCRGRCFFVTSFSSHRCCTCGYLLLAMKFLSTCVRPPARRVFMVYHRADKRAGFLTSNVTCLYCLTQSSRPVPVSFLTKA